MHRLSVEEFKGRRKLPLIVVLDDVRSLYNGLGVPLVRRIPCGGGISVRHHRHAA